MTTLVHYYPEEGREQDILYHLERMASFVKYCTAGILHGFQLNMSWPNINLLKDYRKESCLKDKYLVLQINQEALEKAGNTPQGVVERLSHYIGLIDAILLDPSGGRGQPFDPVRARESLDAITRQG